MIDPKRAASVLVLAFMAAACGDDTSSGPTSQPSQLVSVEAGAAQSVASCATVSLNGTLTGTAKGVRWESLDDLLVFVEQGNNGTAHFRAPSVVVETHLRMQLRALDASNRTLSDIVDITVRPAAADPSLAAGMAQDCAPFRHGVASGDPLPDGVVLWTRISPAAPSTTASVDWELASDSQFTSIVARGASEARAADDFTVQVSVDGLEPAHTYYYHFRDAAGVWSGSGRTRTAPVGHVEGLQIAVASCSSIYSGYFNAYRRIAERADLDLMIHVGDYIYDFVDENEQVRVPTPYPSEPQNLQDWRARHAYYLADPDLRRARAMHPWMLIWDNHDTELSAAPTYNGSVQAFREWNPIRLTDPQHPNSIYRTAHFGDLADIILVDAYLHRNIDKVPGTDAFSMIGNQQFDWLADQLRGSRAAWRLLGNQRLMGTVRINPTYAAFISGERRDVFDTAAWDGFPEDRSRLLNLLVDEGIKDNVILSGDSHISVALDLIDKPLVPNYPSAGVEFLPTSISRGNFDEALTGLGFTPDLQASLLRAIATDTARRNPHHRYVELTKHGYGVLNITAEQVEATIWYSDILSRVDVEEPSPTLIVERGANRWLRD